MALKQEVTVTQLNYSNYDSEVVIPGNLRPWQMEAHKKIMSAFSKNKQHFFVVKAVTGSGKSKLARVISAEMHKKDNNLRTMILVPKCNIGRGFSGGEEEIYIGKKKIKVSSVLNIDQLHENSKDKVNKLIEFLIGDNTISKITITTHACLASAWEKMQPKEKRKIKNLLVIVDELHHARGDSSINNEEDEEDKSIANKLGEFFTDITKYSEERNYYGLGLTATPFRTDGGSLFPGFDETPDHKYHIYEHLKSNKHLRSFSHKFHVTTDTGFNRVKEILVANENSGRVILTIPTKAHAIWKNKTKNTLTTILESISDNSKFTKDKNYPFLIHTKIGKVDKVILDLVTEETQSKGMEYLDNTYKDKTLTKIDIMIQVKVFSEGSDWPEARVIIMLGQCQSLVTMIQTTGRVLRDHKIKKNKPAILHHVLPLINLKTDVSGALNNILKSLSIALALGAVNCSLDEIVGTHDDGTPGLDWKKILEDAKGSNAMEFMKDAFSVAQDFRNSNVNANSTVREQNEAAIKHLENYLKENDIPKAREVAEGMVKFAIRTHDHGTKKVKIGGMKGIDVKDINIDIIGKQSIYNNVTISTGHKKFKQSYLEILRLDNIEWQDSYNSYFKFCKNNNRTPRQKAEGEEGRLGVWGQRQRALKNIMVKYRSDLLNSQEWWSWDVLGDSGLKFIADLTHFVKTEGKWPAPSSKEPHEKYLGKKVNQVKNDIKKGIKRNEWQEQMMLIPGFELNVFYARWDIKLKWCIAYIEKIGNPPSQSSDNPEIKSHGHWWSRNTLAYRNDELPKYQAEQLTPYLEFFSRDLDDVFAQFILDMDEYWANHGDVPLQDTKLGARLSQVREYIKNGTISDTKRTNIENKPWLWYRTLNNIFDYSYNHLNEFYKVNKRLPTQREKSPDGFNVGDWLTTQRKNHKKGKLSDDRVTMLKKIPGALPE